MENSNNNIEQNISQSNNDLLKNNSNDKKVENINNNNKRRKFKLYCISIIIFTLFICCGISSGIFYLATSVDAPSCPDCLNNTPLKNDNNLNSIYCNKINKNPNSFLYKSICINEPTQNKQNNEITDNTDNSRKNITESKENQGITKREQKENINNISLKEQESLVTKLVDEYSNSVVTIVAESTFNNDFFNLEQLEQKENIGSGFIIRKDGLIVTNSHVVEDESLTYSVLLKDQKNPLPVKKIIKDPVNDIALLKIDSNNLIPAKLGNSDNLKKGNFVIAMGSPLGDLTDTVTMGIVSGLNREVSAGMGGQNGGIFQQQIQTNVKKFQGVIQTDAAVNPGNSGGPLINLDGEVIGVNFATTSGANNISFALPINRVKQKIEEFDTLGRFIQPFIGIRYDQRIFSTKSGILIGALITEVQSNSPADNGGLKKGDIVLSANDLSLEDNSLQTIIQESKVGSNLNLQVWRKGQEINLSITVGDKSKEVPNVN